MLKSLSLAVLVAGFSIGLSSCWNKNYNEPGRIDISKRPTEAYIPASYERTWAATQAILAKFPITKRDIDPATGRAYIVTDWIRGKSDVLYHGFDVNRIPYIIRYKLYVYVVGDQRGGKTQVTIKNSEQYSDDVITAGVDIQGNLETWIKTDSSTLKENALLQEITRLVKDPKFSGEVAE
ncbi:MAG: hypothetical protein J0L93_11440 [Deltaproteobacteria bacterium]|nr:hypothetical protein [Deltaproteobacteria bacterium]